MTRVLVVEDHWVWADAVVHQLEGASGVSVVGVATSADEALRLAAELRPDIALVDLLLGEDSGLRVARTLRARMPALRVVMVTAEPSAWAIAEARAAGVVGFVSKDDLVTGEQVKRLIAEVMRGRNVVSARVAAIEASSTRDGAALADVRFGLSAQEVELVRCLSHGLGTVDIGRQLSIGPQTVRNKTSAIGAKLGVSGRLEIVAKALSEGIIPPPSYQ